MTDLNEMVDRQQTGMRRIKVRQRKAKGLCRRFFGLVDPYIDYPSMKRLGTWQNYLTGIGNPVLRGESWRCA